VSLAPQLVAAGTSAAEAGSSRISRLAARHAGAELAEAPRWNLALSTADSRLSLRTLPKNEVAVLPAVATASSSGSKVEKLPRAISSVCTASAERVAVSFARVAAEALVYSRPRLVISRTRAGARPRLLAQRVTETLQKADVAGLGVGPRQEAAEIGRLVFLQLKSQVVKAGGLAKKCRQGKVCLNPGRRR